jgi:hypothetical protein
LRSHEIRSGTYTQNIWTDEKGKRKQKLVRDKPNPDKVTLKRVMMMGFKIELFYYKDTPENLFIGVGDKISIIEDYQLKELKSLVMTATNKKRLTGTWTKKKMNEQFKELMKENRRKEKEERITKFMERGEKLVDLPETDPFRLRMREILNK